MAARRITAESLSVVVRGDFNPALFSPLWFFTENLIGKTEWEDSELGVISQDVTSFRVGWLQVNVQANHLQLTTDQPEEFIRLRDAAIGILRTLKGTPVAALGINRDVHLTVDSVETWHTIGNVLVPKEPWSDLLTSAGMRSVTLWGERPDGRDGRVQVKVEPSQRYPHSIYVQQNDHFQFKSDDSSAVEESTWISAGVGPSSPANIPLALSVLETEWDKSLERSELVEERVVRMGSQE